MRWFGCVTYRGLSLSNVRARDQMSLKGYSNLHADPDPRIREFPITFQAKYEIVTGNGPKDTVNCMRTDGHLHWRRTEEFVNSTLPKVLCQ